MFTFPRDIDGYTPVKVGSGDCHPHFWPHALRVSWCLRGLTALTASLWLDKCKASFKWLSYRTQGTCFTR